MMNRCASCSCASMQIATPQWTGALSCNLAHTWLRPLLLLVQHHARELFSTVQVRKTQLCMPMAVVQHAAPPATLACIPCRNEFSAYLLLEKTDSSGGAAAPGQAARGSSGGLTFSSVDAPVLQAGVAHRELISGLMHVDTGNGPDKWYRCVRVTGHPAAGWWSCSCSSNSIVMWVLHEAGARQSTAPQLG